VAFDMVATFPRASRSYCVCWIGVYGCTVLATVGAAVVSVWRKLPCCRLQCPTRFCCAGHAPASHGALPGRVETPHTTTPQPRGLAWQFTVAPVARIVSARLDGTSRCILQESPDADCVQEAWFPRPFGRRSVLLFLSPSTNLNLKLSSRRFRNSPSRRMGRQPGAS
jgi:hypothetical protein